MRKSFKILSTLILSIVMILAVTLVCSAESVPTAEGFCGADGGENLKWEYFEDTKTLVISGTGKMGSYLSTTSPFYPYRNLVENLVIEEGVTHIGRYAFVTFTKLGEVYLPDSLQAIYGFGFYKSTGITKLHIGTGLKSIEANAFNGCSGVKEVHIKDLAQWCSIKFVGSMSNPISRGASSTVNGAATGRLLYLNGEKVTHLVFPEEVTRIEAYAFYNCASITQVTFHDNIEYIGSGAFSYCNYITTMNFNNAVFTTGSATFGVLNRLRVMNVNNIGAYASSTFTSNPLRTKNNPPLTIDGNKFTISKDDTPYTVIIPEGTTKLVSNAFYARRNLQAVYIPASVTTISGTAKYKGAFNYCSGLTTIYGVAGSAAETYASKCGYKFVAITPVLVTNVALDKSTATVAVGSTVKLTATVTPSDATFNNVIWTSSDMNVAQVSGGTVRAISAGTATITATAPSGNVTATCVVTVPEVELTALTLSAETATLHEGHTLTLRPTFDPVNASNKNITWTSSVPAVASVSNGVVTPLSSGTTVITATIGNVSAQCTVEVVFTTVNVTDVTLDITQATLNIGETLQLNATVSPDDATDKTLSWSSNAEAVAKVDANGLVTAVSAGSAEITVTTTDGSFTAVCTIEVMSNEVAVEGIALDSEEISIVLGESHQFVVTYDPADATPVELVWESTRNDVATITQDGLLETVGEGTTIISVYSSENEDIYAECVVNVAATISVSGVTLDKTTVSVSLGDTVILTATVEPNNANQNVTWESSNTNVATVENGVVTTVGTGATIITVTTEEGGFTAECTVVVTAGNEVPPIEW